MNSGNGIGFVFRRESKADIDLALNAISTIFCTVGSIVRDNNILIIRIPVAGMITMNSSRVKLQRRACTVDPFATRDTKANVLVPSSSARKSTNGVLDV